MNTRPIVAIDGPAGSGKSTVAAGVARALDVLVLDTGAMYRAATLAVLEDDVDPTDPAAAAEVARRSEISLGEGDDHAVRLDGRDVTVEIRGPAVTAAV